MQAVTVIGIVFVSIKDLLDALTPEPQRCIGTIHALVPKLASKKYAAFMSEVTTATARLAHKPTSVAEMADYVCCIAQCENARPRLDGLFDEVKDHFNLCKVRAGIR
jgi:hypothetical protein